MISAFSDASLSPKTVGKARALQLIQEKTKSFLEICVNSMISDVVLRLEIWKRRAPANHGEPSNYFLETSNMGLRSP